MSEVSINRYKIDKIHAKSLEGNPVNSPVDRDLRIYLPPGYFESKEKRYPVIIFLHGYAGNNHSWTVTAAGEEDQPIPWDKIPKNILEEVDIERVPTYEKLDEFISSGYLAPFIFVQPDASLHLPHKDGFRNLRGMVSTKGSFYVNSPFTGNYMDYIVNDVVDYMDSNYRTIPDKEHRVLMGGSMGGYGTLYIGAHHPEKFIAAASLSPGNIDIDLLNWKLRIPIYERILGKKFCERIGDATWADILDTNDLVYSKDNPIIPSIKCDENGEIIEFNQKAFENWGKYDLNNVIKQNPESFKHVKLLLNCADNDEFGLTMAAEKIHETLTELGIDHEYDLYSDPKVALTPHMLGIGYHIIPGIKFCLNFIK